MYAADSFAHLYEATVIWVERCRRIQHVHMCLIVLGILCAVQ